MYLRAELGFLGKIQLLIATDVRGALQSGLAAGAGVVPPGGAEAPDERAATHQRRRRRPVPDARGHAHTQSRAAGAGAGSSREQQPHTHTPAVCCVQQRVLTHTACAVAGPSNTHTPQVYAYSSHSIPLCANGLHLCVHAHTCTVGITTEQRITGEVDTHTASLT